MPKPLTNSQLQKLSAGLSSLDGLRTAPDQFEPFIFDADTTWNLALNHTIIAGSMEVFDRAKKTLAVQYGITDRMTVTKENAEQVNAFVAGLDVLLTKEVSVDGLQKIERAKLNIGSGKGQNKIPVSVIGNLMLILE